MIFRLTCLLLALASFWLCVSPVHAKGSTDAVQITTDHFRLSGVMVPEDGIAMISELERYRAALLEVHGLPADTPDRRVDIYIVSDPDIFDVLGVGENFVALYSPTLAGPRALINGSLGVQAFAYASDPAAELEAVLRQNLRHEYGQHFINNFLPVPHPTWIGEGLAEYYAGYDELPDGGYRFGVPQATSVVALSYPVYSGWIGRVGWTVGSIIGA